MFFFFLFLFLFFSFIGNLPLGVEFVSISKTYHFLSKLTKIVEFHTYIKQLYFKLPVAGTDYLSNHLNTLVTPTFFGHPRS